CKPHLSFRGLRCLGISGLSASVGYATVGPVEGLWSKDYPNLGERHPVARGLLVMVRNRLFCSNMTVGRDKKTSVFFSKPFRRLSEVPQNRF
ncbi:MAG: hypothetical protein SPI56_03825, partial [Alloprevotella sp.]|nr:hypothetical protein [Alloprevotella sp.]